MATKTPLANYSGELKEIQSGDTIPAAVIPSLDATLTALAAQNWALNALPIGSGADTLAQVSFAANTFPARASTGNLVAKSISDFALTVLDDTTAAAMRATLATPTVGDAVGGGGSFRILYQSAGGLLAADSTFIRSGDNVAIGTATPTTSANYSTLTINGTTGGQIAFKNNGTDKGFIYNDGTNLNIYAIANTVITNGGLGVGVSPTAKLHVMATTEQFRVGYDASNYGKWVVGPAGINTLTAVGASAAWVFENNVALLAGKKLSLTHDGTNAALRLVPVSGTPSSLSDGDIWYDSSLNKFLAKQNGSVTNLVGFQNNATTPNAIAKSDGNDIQNSQIMDDGTTVSMATPGGFSFETNVAIIGDHAIAANGVMVKVDQSVKLISLLTGANNILAELPTSDPGVINYLWNDNGTVKISI